MGQVQDAPFLGRSSSERSRLAEYPVGVLNVVAEGLGMQVRVGTDLVYIPRLTKSLAAEGLVARVFTRGEQEYCHSRPERYAGRWAAKEATMKALGCGLDTIPLRDIEVFSDRLGAPGLILHGRARDEAAQAGWRDVSVSISHDGDYAMAIVMVAVNRESSVEASTRTEG